MAKKSAIEKNNRRRRMSKKYSGPRSRLKAVVNDKTGRLKSALPHAQACQAAAQFVRHPHPQPL